jgi:hypothetical protein
MRIFLLLIAAFGLSACQEPTDAELAKVAASGQVLLLTDAYGRTYAATHKGDDLWTLVPAK